MTVPLRLTWRIIWSIGVAFAVIATPIPLNALALLAWMVLMAKSRSLGSQVWLNAASRAIPIVAMGAVLWLAIEAPKTKDEIMERQVVLPKTRTTLGELRDWTEGARPLGLRLPIHVSMSLLDSETSQTVEWPARELSLREFVTAIENQTPLRHRFRSCGNGYTIWKGEDCCFGLSFR